MILDVQVGTQLVTELLDILILCADLPVELVLMKTAGHSKQYILDLKLKLVFARIEVDWEVWMFEDVYHRQLIVVLVHLEAAFV